MKIYLVADARFFDEDAAREQNMDINTYNQTIINNLNTFTSEKEPAHFCFFGVITAGTMEQTKDLLSQLGGVKSLIDYNYNQSKFTIEQWKEIGFSFVWTNSCAQRSVINNKDTYVVIEVEKDHLEKVLSLDYYVAIAGSMIGMEDIYKDKLLNISIQNWGLMPIELEEELPRIFDDQELFLRMEDTE